MTTKHGSIAEEFNRFFEVRLVDSHTLLREAQAVRYRVYCEEFKFESPMTFPDGLERDEYDEQSVHCVVRHRASGITAGCVRMVPTLMDAPDAPLPLEKFCGDSLDHAYISSLGLNRHTVCEISRLAVDGRFRRRPGEAGSKYGNADAEAVELSEDEQRTAPFIAISAYLAATAITESTGRTNVFAMMEPFLPRLLKRSGLHFSPAGEVVDYHGKRSAHFITTGSALASMRPDLRELYNSVRHQLFPDGAHHTEQELVAYRAYA